MKTIGNMLKNATPAMKQLALIGLILAALFFGINLGARFASEKTMPVMAAADEGVEHDHGAESAVGEAGKTIWTCSMHPQIRMDKPGKCPLCGMDLVPEKVSPGKKPAKKSGEPAGYACAMNCVPPLPHPGKCSICGMEMQPIFADANTGSDSSRRMTMSDEAKAIAKIETASVERRWVENAVRMVGVVDYDETRLADVTAYVGGRLDRLFVDFTGTQVRTGDHMVEIYSPDLFASQKELQEAKRALDSMNPNTLPAVRQASRATLDAARERLRLWGLTGEQIAQLESASERQERLTIHAPIGGVVIKKHVQEGAYVKTGDRIYTIADLSHLWVKLKAYESDLPWLRYGQDVVFTAEAYPGEAFHGRIVFIEPALNAMSRTVDVRVNVDNADGKLKPGMFLRGEVKSRLAQGGKVIEPKLAGKWISPMHPEIVKDGPGQCDVCGMDLVPAAELGFVAAVEETPPMVIPATAPLITGKRAVVYVEVPGVEQPTYEGREVTLGPRAGDFYIVQHDLEVGENVVTRGAFRIDSALQIVAKPSMMIPQNGGAKQ
ncbi:efflux RND transporter periplasmic adaptor subunit [Candidatus Sumerlaeota bacterium]|nr:efflux RND transporter periplasmic adaptor subunit [Candidatus Sumerlaeota bacterium]